jgi:hypothetical protein
MGMRSGQGAWRPLEFIICLKTIWQKFIVGKGERLCATWGVPLVRHTDLIAVARRSCKELKKKIEQDIEIIQQTRNSNTTTDKTPGRSPSRLVALSSRVFPMLSARTLSPSKLLPPKPSFHMSGVTRPTPAQRSIFKRAAYDDDLADETPSKRKRTMAGGYKAPHTWRPRICTRTYVPSGRQMCCSPTMSTIEGDNTDWNTEMSDAVSVATRSEAEVEAAVVSHRVSSEVEAGPSRPKRLAYQKKPPANILAHTSFDEVDADADAGGNFAVEGEEPAEEPEPEDDTLPPVRRSRPVLADRAQWRARAPRVEALRESDSKGWVAKYGQPFRIVACAGCALNVVAVYFSFQQASLRCYFYYRTKDITCISWAVNDRTRKCGQIGHQARMSAWRRARLLTGCRHLSVRPCGSTASPFARTTASASRHSQPESSRFSGIKARIIAC